MKLFAFCLAVLLASTLHAQTPQPVGSVSGQVLCSDTQGPARFASIYLLPKATTLRGSELRRDSREQREKTLTLVTGKSSLHGSFLIQQVPVGEYYIVASMPGYLAPLQQPTPDPSSAKPKLSDLLGSLPLVHVIADHTVTAELTLRRGGVIAGRVRYDDGSPVVGLSMSFQRIDRVEDDDLELGAGLTYLEGQTSQDTADTLDDGSYRIAGLPPGKYIVYIGVVTEQDRRTTAEWHPGNLDKTEGLRVYAPGVFRRSKARTVEIGEGEQRTGVDLELALEGLHRVQGRVVAGEDLHAAGFATVELKDGEDFGRRTLATDGTFHFNYVPSGVYRLTVSYTALPEKEQGETTQHIVERSVVVTEHDVEVDDVVLEEQKPETRDSGTK